MMFDRYQPPTEESDGCSSQNWPTPATRDWKGMPGTTYKTESGAWVRESNTTGQRFGAQLDGVATNWPSPNVSDMLPPNNKDDHDMKKGHLRGVATNWPTPSATPRGPHTGREFHNNQTFSKTTGTSFGMTLETASQHWMTPLEDDSSNVNPSDRRRLTLSKQIHQTQENWATPSTQEIEHPDFRENLTESGRRKPKKGKTSHSLGLADQSIMAQENWPTPQTRDYKGSTVNSEIRKDGKSRMDHLDFKAELSQYGPQDLTNEMSGSGSSESDQTSPQQSRKRLNTNFVSWLMGVPIGWVNLRVLETESYRQWWHSFSKSL